MTLHPDCARRPLPLALRDEPRRASALPWLAAAVLAAVLSCCIVLCEGCGPSSALNPVVPHDVRVLVECTAADAALRSRGVSEPEIQAAHAACVLVAQRYGAHAPSLDAGVE